MLFIVVKMLLSTYRIAEWCDTDFTTPYTVQYKSRNSFPIFRFISSLRSVSLSLSHAHMYASYDKKALSDRRDGICDPIPPSPEVKKSRPFFGRHFLQFDLLSFASASTIFSTNFFKVCWIQFLHMQRHFQKLRQKLARRDNFWQRFYFGQGTMWDSFLRGTSYSYLAAQRSRFPHIICNTYT